MGIIAYIFFFEYSINKGLDNDFLFYYLGLKVFRYSIIRLFILYRIAAEKLKDLKK